MNNLELKNRDLDVLWHPCTQMKDHETLPLTPIKKLTESTLKILKEISL